MKKAVILDAIVFLLMLLFTYAAITKLLDYKLFVGQIRSSTLLSDYAKVLAWVIPLIELFITVALFTIRFRSIGLYSSFVLMTIFTFYIVASMLFTQYKSCSCGGILSRMGWTEHLIFNILFTGLAFIGISLNARRQVNAAV